MSETFLTQTEADALLAMEKHKIDDKETDFPSLGGRFSLQLASSDKRELFFLDCSRSALILSKCTYQNRARTVVVLVRLDIDGPAHQNPDGEVIPCPHLHLYREGYADKWALELPPDVFADIDDLYVVLDDFMKYCNVVEPPRVVKGLFS